MDNLIRCGWCLSSDLYKEYHDKEWGTPIYDDATLLKFLILETFQAGLSWITVLNKRENFRKVFDNFNYKKIALYPEDKIEALLLEPGIIRNRLKVRSAVSNAQTFMVIQKEFGSFSKYIWAFTNGAPIINHPKTMKEVPATSPLSDTISTELRKRGFKFMGSTVIYAYLQATGLIDDHVNDCWTKKSANNGVVFRDFSKLYT